MQKMTPEETRSFLLQTPRTGKLATVREDGRPHIAPIWFDMDGDDIVFTTWHTTVKANNIRHDNRASLCVDDDRPPFSFVIIEGTIDIVNLSPAELVPWTTRIAARYMGASQADSFGKRNGVEGELLLRLKPGKIMAVKGMSD